MAINLTVALTDSEQARIVEIAAFVSPGATGPQIKAWAEKVCKDALREAVREQALKGRQEAENVARQEAAVALKADWPEDGQESGGQI
jgi:homoserine kinase